MICKDERRHEAVASHELQYIEEAYLFPCSNLGVVPDAGRVRLTASLAGDVGSFSDEERTGDAGALSVVLDAEIGVNMLAVRTETGEGGEHNPVGELDVADLDGLEESRGAGGGHVSEVRMVGKSEESVNECALLILERLGLLGEYPAADRPGGKRAGNAKEHV